MRQKRFLSWIMVFTLLVGMFSFPAYAEGNTTTISGDGTAEKTGTMTVTLVIPKKTPAATDLTYTAPSDLTYSGSDKAATVAVASGVTGLGTITVKYYSDAARTTEVTETKNVGTYYVGVTLAEGDEYAASTAVVYGDGWTFTITASTPSAPAAPTKASATKNSITLDAVDGCEYSRDGASWQDSPAFTGLLPGTEYTFYQRVKATANTNASSSSSASFSTEADTYGMTITLTIEPKITGYALELGGVLGLRYYMALPTGTDIDYTDAKMTFSMNYREDQVIPYSQLMTDTQGKYFTCGVYAYQMADEITATFTYKKDGATKTLTDTYSVKAYLDSLATDPESSKETLALVNATRNYGHYVQPYLHRLGTGEYETVMPAGTGTPDIGAAKTDSAAKAVQSTGAYLDSSYFSGAIIRLNVNTGTDLVFELKPVAGFEDTLSATVDDTSYDVTLNGRGVYRIAKQTIAANNLEVESRFNVKHGTEDVFTITASPMNYISLVLGQSTAEDECNALAALYEYWAAADGYNHSGA